VIAELVGPCYVEFDEAMADLNWTESTGGALDGAELHGFALECC
jgi:hypothetical protein